MDHSPLNEALSALVSAILLALVVYPTTLYLIEEEGPFGVFRHIRWLFGHRQKVANLADDGEGLTFSYFPNDWVTAKVISCTRCLPPWVSFIYTVVAYWVGILPDNWLLWPLVWLGAAGIVVFGFEMDQCGADKE